MRLFSILAALALCPSATGQVQLSFAPTPANYIRVLGGKVFIGSQQSSRTQMVISGGLFGGSGNDIPLDAKLDPSGNIWIAGTTDSDDFPLVNPIVSQKVAYRTAGFVLELDPSAKTLLFATYLGGHQPTVPAYYSSSASALAIDAAGNVYVAGTTDEPDFPTTAGAFLRSGPDLISSLGTAEIAYSYAMKISPAGKLLYSTFLRTGAFSCGSGAYCLTTSAQSTGANVTSMAADSTGALTVCGVAYGELTGIGYVWRLSADASKLLWSNSVGNQFATVKALYMGQDAKGNVQLLGTYAPLVDVPLASKELGTPGLFSEQITADGSQQLNLVDYGQSADSAATGVSIDASGNAYLSGTSSSPQLPIPSGLPKLGSDFILSKGTVLYSLPRGVIAAPPTFDAAGNLQILGAQGALLTLPPTNSFTTPAIVGFANSASYSVNTGFYLGTLVSLFGYNLPPNPQVVINGTSVPILFAGPNQINVQMPSSLNVYTFMTTVALSPGVVSFNAPSVQSVGIFTVDGTYAAALNQDGTANSSSNPAASGSIISLFGTGTTQPSVIASINGYPVNVAYFGPAPGLSGVFQANIQVTPGKITLQPHGSSSSDPVSNTVLVYAK